MGLTHNRSLFTFPEQLFVVILRSALFLFFISFSAMIWSFAFTNFCSFFHRAFDPFRVHRTPHRFPIETIEIFIRTIYKPNNHLYAMSIEQHTHRYVRTTSTTRSLLFSFFSGENYFPHSRK